MLVLTETGFLEIVKEPQFEEIYTVQATDLNSVRLIRKHTMAKAVLNDYSRKFRFYTYAYLDGISRALDMPINPEDVHTLDRNISPAPVGYRVLGTWFDKDEKVELDILAEDLRQFISGTELNFDEFRAWPLFHMTNELIEQKNPGR
jgi:hypothetical protein